MTLKNWIAMAAAALMLAASPVLAQGPADKVTVDAAKAQGIVGEQGDGYLGIVGNATPAITAAVTAINAGRSQVYADTAAKTGVTRDAAGQATGEQLIARTPAGQFIKPLGGAWTKK
jgi:uncharacterized protein YdbL (DUF1318 family)